ncbi:MAG: hypothetical protein NT175_04015 [Bacteroidetes bacterium]|nr:hypothetical protein [Bacteroidota bacterium]
MFIQVDSNRFTDHKGDMYDSEAKYNYLLGEVIDIKHYNDEIV